MSFRYQRALPKTLAVLAWIYNHLSLHRMVYFAVLFHLTWQYGVVLLAGQQIPSTARKHFRL